jgi:hypothetical protein
VIILSADNYPSMATGLARCRAVKTEAIRSGADLLSNWKMKNGQ